MEIALLLGQARARRPASRTQRPGPTSTSSMPSACIRPCLAKLAATTCGEVRVLRLERRSSALLRGGGWTRRGRLSPELAPVGAMACPPARCGEGTMAERQARGRTVIVFDLGGVLIDWNPRHLYRKLFDDEAAMEWFLTEVCHAAWNEEQDRGRSFAAAIEEAAARHPGPARADRGLPSRAGSEMMAGPIEGTVAILEELTDAGYELHALTNWSAETFPIARRALRLPRAGSRPSWSRATSGLIKPDARIFELLLERIAPSGAALHLHRRQRRATSRRPPRSASMRIALHRATEQLRAGRCAVAACSRRRSRPEMRRALRWLARRAARSRAAASSIGLARRLSLAAPVAAARSMARSEVAGLEAPVTIVRDAHGRSRTSRRKPRAMRSSRTASCTPRTGCGRWSSAAGSAPGGSPRSWGRRRCRPTASCARSASIVRHRRASPICGPATVARARGLRRRRQRLSRDPHAGRCRRSF